MELLSSLEAVLFVASKPLSVKKLAKALDISIDDVSETLETLETKYNHESSGIHLFFSGDTVRMGTNPAYADVVDQFISYDIGGDLTKAQLETLTVIAYRGPITRPELEEIRGVNCAIILRNLLMRGLISEKQDEEKLLPVFVLSVLALSHLGISSMDELPQYDELNTHPHLDQELIGE
ncbi:MAG: SMC-Scp complex subunit ScpB [Candidatus Magasanikbacteria bacterium]|jgi:segregation and condensation protein B|nr:SMC-Scp complex subunit ScpB [Candidatus Magasanikbacteria bacterium]MBT4071270.1 SMC-Scp complex subunit ScpB [Candidatus Magasanikbacteria bacterium]